MPTLIWVHHHPHDGLTKKQEIWTLYMDETRYVYSGGDHLHGGVLYLVTLIVQGQWLSFSHWIQSSRIAPHCPTCIIYEPNKKYVDLVFDTFMVKALRSI